MNRGEEALKLIRLWTKKKGYKTVRLDLANAADENGELICSFSTADRLARGTYDSTPGHEITEAIFKCAAKAGITLVDEKAS